MEEKQFKRWRMRERQRDRERQRETERKRDRETQTELVTYYKATQKQAENNKQKKVGDL